MWNKVKRNEIVIYSIALMLITAGYFNYSASIDKNLVDVSNDEIYSENIDNIVAENTNNVNDNEVDVGKKGTENRNDENIGDAALVNSNDVIENTNVDTPSTGNNEENVTTLIDDYFVSTKLERNTNYATMISNYTKILEDGNINEAQKAIAMQEITKINDIQNAISICENLLTTKGFINSVVLVNGDSVNIVVLVYGGLQVEMVAQIQNIISRELNASIENIHISEKE